MCGEIFPRVLFLSEEGQKKEIACEGFFFYLNEFTGSDVNFNRSNEYASRFRLVVAKKKEYLYRDIFLENKILPFFSRQLWKQLNFL